MTKVSYSATNIEISQSIARIVVQVCNNYYV